MLAVVQAAFPRGMRTVSLSLNLGAVVVLGGSAGKAAAASLARRKSSRPGEGAGEAASAAGSPGDGPSLAVAAAAAAGASAATPLHPPSPAKARRRTSRWLSARPLFSGAAARGFASLPCPVPAPAHPHTSSQEYLPDTQHWHQQCQGAALQHWEHSVQSARWQGPSPAPAAGVLRSAAACPSRPPPPPSPSSTSTPHLARGPHAQLPSSTTLSSPHPLAAWDSPGAESPGAVSPLPRRAAPGAQQGAPGTSPTPLPWELLPAAEQQSRLTAFRAECQPYAQHSMHSMTLPFILEAYSLAQPPQWGGAEGPGLHRGQPVPGRAGASKAPLAASTTAGGAQVPAVAAALRRHFSRRHHEALDRVLTRLEGCYSKAGGWRGGHGPAQIREGGLDWKPPNARRASRMAAFLLKEADASEEEVLAALAAHPWLLGLGLDSHARPTLDQLVRHGLMGAHPRQQLGQHEEAGDVGLGFSSGGEEERWARGADGKGSEVGRLVTSRPLLMLLSPECELDPLLQYLEGLGLDPPAMLRLMRCNSLLAGPGGLQRLQLLVSFLAGKGLSRGEVAHVVERVPRVLQYTPEALQYKWQYMEQALGGGSRDIAACPYYLEASLENVLGPRVALAKELGVPILLPSQLQGEGQRRGGVKARAKAGGRDSRDSGISLWKLIYDKSTQLATKLGTTAEEMQRHMHRWQQTQQHSVQPPRDLDYYMGFCCGSAHRTGGEKPVHGEWADSTASRLEAHLATQQRCCVY